MLLNSRINRSNSHFMSRRICIVVSFSWDTERLKRGVLVSRRHRLVAGLVARVHRFTYGDDRVLAAVFGGYKVKLDSQRDVKQRRALAVLALDNLSVGDTRQDAQPVL